MFYRSFYEAIKDVPKKYRSVIYEAVFEYVFDSQEPSLSGVPSALWKLIRPQIDASQKRYENSKKGAEYGKMGGRPKKTKESEKPLKGYEEKPLKGKKVETLNVNVNSNSNVNENVNVNSSGPDGEQLTDNNHIPTMKEIREENIRNEYGLTEDSLNRFVAYNRERGWKMLMPDALRKWKELEKEKPKQNKAGKFGDFQQRDDAKHRTMVSKVIAMNEGE